MDLPALQQAAQRHVAGLTRTDDLPSSLPESFKSKGLEPTDLASIIATLKDQNRDNDSSLTHINLLILEVHLRDTPHPQHQPPKAAYTNLRNLLTSFLRPSPLFAERSPFAAEPPSPTAATQRRRLRALYETCLLLVSHFQTLFPIAPQTPETDLFLALASFTHPSDPWTTPASYSLANSLLAIYLPPLRVDPSRFSALLDSLLRERIKPLFAKSKNPAVTPAGRKAITPLPVPIEHGVDEVEIKPWKYGDCYIVTVFEWVLQQLDSTTTPPHLPLLIPPLLALLDDPSTPLTLRGCTPLTLRGCTLLRLFLRTAPSPLLQRTGLGEVFHSALMPNLLYLPSLTPEAESLELLGGVYPALVALVRARFGGEGGGGRGGQGGRQKALDEVFRVGVIKGYKYAGENVRVAEFLVGWMGELVREMGVESCKYLKNILPLLTAILTAPFATAYPPLLLAALAAMETVVLVDWPRVGYHRGEILKGLVGCWLRVEKEGEGEGRDEGREEGGKEEAKRKGELRDVKNGIRRCLKLLTAVLEKEVDVGGEYRLLAESDGRLGGLLVV